MKEAGADNWGGFAAKGSILALSPILFWKTKLSVQPIDFQSILFLLFKMKQIYGLVRVSHYL